MIICRGTNTQTHTQTDNYLPNYSGISSHSKELVYGKMLRRMWNGDLTSEDRKKLTPE